MKIRILVGISSEMLIPKFEQTIRDYIEDFWGYDIFFLDNDGYKFDFNHTVKFFSQAPALPLSISTSWNNIMRYAADNKYTHVLLIRDNVYLGTKMINILDTLKETPHVDLMLPENSYYVALLSVFAFGKYNGFDELFTIDDLFLREFEQRLIMNEAYVKKNILLNPNNQTIAQKNSVELKKTITYINQLDILKDSYN